MGCPECDEAKLKAAMALHDVKNLLTAVLGFLEPRTLNVEQARKAATMAVDLAQRTVIETRDEMEP